MKIRRMVDEVLGRFTKARSDRLSLPERYFGARRPEPKSAPKLRLPREASAWIELNPREYPFGTNVFSRESALRFVRGLYRAGAEMVKVGSIDVRDPGEPYSDTLLVKVSPRKEKRLLAYVGRNKGVQPDEVRKTKSGYRLWWD